MRRVTLLTLAAALLVALTAGVAAAKVISGTTGDDKLVGTNRADTLRGFDGDDRLYGRGGDDTLKGYIGDDFPLRGAKGDDTIVGGLGADRSYGQGGSDTIRTVGDAQRDYISCGEDADGQDIDTADVSGNDVVDGTLAGALTTTTVTSCEVIFVDGIRIPQL